MVNVSLLLVSNFSSADDEVSLKLLCDIITDTLIIKRFIKTIELLFVRKNIEVKLLKRL